MSVRVQTRSPFSVNERTSALFTGVLKDQLREIIKASQLFTAKLWLFDVTTDAIINGRDGQNVLNMNGVTIDELGNLTWVMEPDDNMILGTRAVESHCAHWQFQWNGGISEMNTEIVINVKNLRRIRTETLSLPLVGPSILYAPGVS